MILFFFENNLEIIWTSLTVGLNPGTECPVRGSKGEIAQKGGTGNVTTEIGAQVVSPRHPGSPQKPQEAERIPPRASRSKRGPPAPGAQTLGLQNTDKINYCCFS